MQAFISYSHTDAELLSQLKEHLSALKRQGLLDAWTDREIPPGGVIDDHVTTEIEQAQLYLLLVSSAFMDSDYCMEREFARALERQEAGEAIIVPIIVRDCDWMIPKLGGFKALPKDGKAITSRHWHNTDEAFKSVAQGLRLLLEQVPELPVRPKSPHAKEVAAAEGFFVPEGSHMTHEPQAPLKRQVKMESGELLNTALAVGHARDASSNGDVHTYWLTIAFTNESPSKQEGYTLELLFPVEVPVECAADDYQIEEHPVTVGVFRYQRFTLSSNESIFRGQTVQLVDRVRCPVSYRMDDALYSVAHGGTWEFRCKFYAGNMQATETVIPWSSMHEF